MFCPPLRHPQHSPTNLTIMSGPPLAVLLPQALLRARSPSHGAAPRRKRSTCSSRRSAATRPSSRAACSRSESRRSSPWSRPRFWAPSPRPLSTRCVQPAQRTHSHTHTHTHTHTHLCLTHTHTHAYLCLRNTPTPLSTHWQVIARAVPPPLVTLDVPPPPYLASAPLFFSATCRFSVCSQDASALTFNWFISEGDALDPALAVFTGSQVALDVPAGTLAAGTRYQLTLITSQGEGLPVRSSRSFTTGHSAL
eukprot:263880-Rhodomonas_salina.1